MRLGLFLLFCLPIAAQAPAVGVKIGVPVTGNFQTGTSGYPHGSFSSSSKPRPYTFGLSAALPLPNRFSFEIDGLYRRINYDWNDLMRVSQSDGGTISSWSATTGNRIDIPLLLRWSPVRSLYLAGGPAFAIHYGFDQRTHTIQDLAIAGYKDTTTAGKPIELASRASKGLTFGLGFDAPAGALHLKPEIRYTHWISPAFDSRQSFHPVTNELEFLLGFEFGVRK